MSIKIAVYTIALNEEQFVERWYESAKEADYLLIADTGSADRTVEIAKELGIDVISVSVSPWRFDDARNAALAHVPLDIDMCVSLDMDEVLSEGWRRHLEKAWENGITRPTYKHHWSPDVEFAYDHIHARAGYRWRHPVHEALYPYGIPEVRRFIEGLETFHYPDPTKSRAQYLPLLKMSIEEDPNNERNSFYYAREMFFHGYYDEAVEEFQRYLALPTSKWGPEREAAKRYIAICNPGLTPPLLRGGKRRETLVDLAGYYHDREMWVECLDTAEKALKIEEKPLDYLCEAYAWGSKPYDLAAISAYHLGKLDLALMYGEKAVELSPDDERLKGNLKYYKES